MKNAYSSLKKKLYRRIAEFRQKTILMKKLSFILLLISSIASSQPNMSVRNPGDTLQSIRVLADGKVVLSIYAPKASEVSVMGDFLKEYQPMQLTKTDNGVWSVTLTDIRPDLYTYDFTVDGVRTFDQRNPIYKGE
jgi:enterochelin esterase family protein